MTTNAALHAREMEKDIKTKDWIAGLCFFDFLLSAPRNQTKRNSGRWMNLLNKNIQALPDIVH